MEISRELLPDSFDRLIPVWELELDPYNVREEQPTDDLVESVRKTGFRDAAIVRPSEDRKFLVTDGWQRVQAGVRAGWTEIPCNIYKTPLEALKEANRASIRREWTKYQRIKHYRNYYEACREEGMDHWEAVQKTVSDNPATEQAVMRYLRITRLPPLVQALLKEPKNRTPQEWNQLEKIYYTIRQKRKTLTIGKADAIATYLKNFPPEKQIRAAIGVLGLTDVEARYIIQVISRYPEEDPFEIIQELNMGYSTDEILDIGLIIVDSELKRDLQEYCSMRRITLKDLMTVLLAEWQTGEKGASYKPVKPLLSGEAEIGEVSFKIGGRQVTILQQRGFPTIIVEGSPPCFFSHREVKDKAWNRNVKLPSQLIDFLNSLKIELRKK